MGCSMASKVSFLDFRLYFFPANPSVVSDFTKGISVMEQRYQGRYNPSMLADYCWTVRRGVPQARYNDIFHCYFSGNIYYLYNIRYIQFFLEIHPRVTYKPCLIRKTDILFEFSAKKCYRVYLLLVL